LDPTKPEVVRPDGVRGLSLVFFWFLGIVANPMSARTQNDMAANLWVRT
jgi:hypothetical protein